MTVTDEPERRVVVSRQTELGPQRRHGVTIPVSKLQVHAHVKEWCDAGWSLRAVQRIETDTVTETQLSYRFRWIRPTTS